VRGRLHASGWGGQLLPGLVDAGVEALSYNKRGVGESEGECCPGDTGHFNLLTADVVGAVQAVRDVPRRRSRALGQPADRPGRDPIADRLGHQSRQVAPVRHQPDSCCSNGGQYLSKSTDLIKISLGGSGPTCHYIRTLQGGP
jgi:hypothetical protein